MVRLDGSGKEIDLGERTLQDFIDLSLSLKQLKEAVKGAKDLRAAAQKALVKASSKSEKI